VGGVTEGDIEGWEILYDLLSIIFWTAVDFQNAEVGVSAGKMQGILAVVGQHYHLSTDLNHTSRTT
jgi:hypothetical protein